MKKMLNDMTLFNISVKIMLHKWKFDKEENYDR